MSNNIYQCKKCGEVKTTYLKDDILRCGYCSGLLDKPGTKVNFEAHSKSTYYCRNCGEVKTTYLKDNILRCGYCSGFLENPDKKVNFEDHSNNTPINKNNLLEEVSNIFFLEFGTKFIGVERTYFYEIPIDKLKNAKYSHNLDHNDTVLLLIDHTFWGNATDSTLFTTTGISIYKEGFNEPIFLPYKDIKSVDYKDGQFLFHMERGETEPIDDSYLVYKSKQIIKLKPVFLNLINKLSAVFVNEHSVYWNELQQNIEEENYEKILELTNKYLEEYGETGEYSLESYCNRADALTALGRLKEALEDIDIAEELCPKEDPYFGNIMSIRADISKQSENFEDTLRCLIKSKSFFPDKKIQKNINEEIAEIYLQYKESFSKLSRDEKKIIYISEELKLTSKHFRSYKRIDYPSIEFPVGHPIDDHFYLMHPYLENKYIPLQNYENILFRDKVRELSFVLQCLGAKSITITSLKGNSVESLENSSVNFKGEGTLKIHSAKTSIDSKNSSEKNSKSIDQLSTTQKFSPTVKPFLPDSLLWYTHEPEWQQIYQQRMNGHLDSYSITIINQFSNLNKSNILKKIQAEYKNLVLEVDLEFSENISKQFSEEGFTEWRIEAEFVPVNELSIDVKVTDPINNNSLSKEEEEFTEMFKDAFEDGHISDDERKLLEKKRIRLNISEQRAKELEQIAQKGSFSEQEEDYIDMLKDSLEDGIISDDERKLLEKRRTKLGISVERAKEIEKLFIE